MSKFVLEDIFIEKIYLLQNTNLWHFDIFYLFELSFFKNSVNECFGT